MAYVDHQPCHAYPQSTQLVPLPADPIAATKLAFLHLAPGDLKLDPAFSPEVSTYQVKVGSGRLQVTLTARALHCAAEVRLLGSRRNMV